jgi:predicted HD phosphohydrolase
MQLAQQLESAGSGDARSAVAIREVLTPRKRDSAACQHTPPSSFRSRQPLAIHLAADAGQAVLSVHLYFRHVNQAERFREVQMKAQAGRFAAEIPADYTDSPYPLQYYFELRSSPERAWMYPGFDDEPFNQPYFVVQRTGDSTPS